MSARGVARARRVGAAQDPGPLRRSILRWYLKHRRDLPWRLSRDPYAIWVSEIMLQQTRVETVIPYYRRFLERFPSVTSLAKSRERNVLAAWSGLGYYGRARNLHDAASCIVREHDGCVPSDLAALRRLPGIGAYTAAAIASVAFGRPAAAVDGNVIRVLARISGWRGRRDSALLRRRVGALAEGLASGPLPGDWTQALMELGATVCLPRTPRCEDCPARAVCVARASGDPDRYPEPARAAAPKAGRRLLLFARRNGRVLLVPDTDSPGAGWTLPTAAIARSAAATARRLAKSHGALGEPRGPVARFSHRTFSSHFQFEVWEADWRVGKWDGTGRWVAPRSIDKLAVRAPTLKALRGMCDPGHRR